MTTKKEIPQDDDDDLPPPKVQTGPNKRTFWERIFLNPSTHELVDMATEKLLQAYRNDDVGAARKALARHARANEEDAFGSVGMHHFAAHANLEGVQLMYDAHGDVNHKNKRNHTPLDMAIINGRFRDWLEQRKAIDSLLAAGEVILPQHIETARNSDQAQIAEYLKSILDGKKPRPTTDDVKSLGLITVVNGAELQGKIASDTHTKSGGKSCHAG